MALLSVFAKAESSRKKEASRGTEAWPGVMDETSTAGLGAQAVSTHAMGWQQGRQRAGWEWVWDPDKEDQVSGLLSSERRIN